MVSESAAEYRARAEECDRLAKLTANGEVRRSLHYLAKCWRDFSRDAAVNGPSDPNFSIQSDGGVSAT